MEGKDQVGISPIFVVLLGVMSAAVVLTVYHCISVTWCNPQRPIHRPHRAAHARGPDTGMGSESLEFSTVQLVPPARVYGKGEGMVRGDADHSTCPVCLSDFKDGEAVRLLPECLHCFHVLCIDMWLMSHTSCPMCRSLTATSATMELESVHPDSGERTREAVAGALLPSLGG